MEKKKKPIKKRDGFIYNRVVASENTFVIKCFKWLVPLGLTYVVMLVLFHFFGVDTGAKFCFWGYKCFHADNSFIVLLLSFVELFIKYIIWLVSVLGILFLTVRILMSRVAFLLFGLVFMFAGAYIWYLLFEFSTSYNNWVLLSFIATVLIEIGLLWFMALFRCKTNLFRMISP